MTPQPLDRDAAFAVPSHVLIREVGGEAVLLDIRGESYFGLDAMGTRMWRALVAAPDLGSALEQLLAEYEVEREILEGDLRDLAGSLVGHGLLDVIRRA